jgi:D-glycero-D-manno-heptose 1,7-bisphosphate phosphatase
MRIAAFLDRDGTLNETVWKNGKPRPPYSYTQVEIIPGTLEAIDNLRKLNYTPVIITNQPDVSRGKVSLEDVNFINKKICKLLKIEFIYMCIHDDKDNCECRKPKPGMIFRAATDLELDLSSSILVGDRWRDIHAGQAAGCKSFLIESKSNEIKPNYPYETVSSLLALSKKLKGNN